MFNLQPSTNKQTIAANKTRLFGCNYNQGRKGGGKTWRNPTNITGLVQFDSCCKDEEEANVIALKAEEVEEK